MPESQRLKVLGVELGNLQQSQKVVEEKADPGMGIEQRQFEKTFRNTDI